MASNYQEVPQTTGYAAPNPVYAQPPNYATAPPVGVYVQPTSDYQYQLPGQPVVQQTVIHVGSCPTCGRGNLEDEFTGCGIAWAIICFPIGLICCFTMRKKKCHTCGYTRDA